LRQGLATTLASMRVPVLASVVQSVRGNASDCDAPFAKGAIGGFLHADAHSMVYRARLGGLRNIVNILTSNINNI